MFDSLVSFFDRLQQGVLIWTFAALIYALAYWRRENETEVLSEHTHEPLPTVSEQCIRNKKTESGWLPGTRQESLHRTKTIES